MFGLADKTYDPNKPKTEHHHHHHHVRLLQDVKRDLTRYKETKRERERQVNDVKMSNWT